MMKSLTWLTVTRLSLPPMHQKWYLLSSGLMSQPTSACAGVLVSSFPLVSSAPLQAFQATLAGDYPLPYNGSGLFHCFLPPISPLNHHGMRSDEATWNRQRGVSSVSTRTTPRRSVKRNRPLHTSSIRAIWKSLRPLKQAFSIVSEEPICDVPKLSV